MPTITRQSFIGSPEQFKQDQSPTTASQPGKRGYPIKKVVYLYKPNLANCAVENLKLARNAGVTTEELVCQSCFCPFLRLE
ncbi:hypothetical protein [Candidatus Coxiella mudrowiae]|uniref:hypothetical protein n=1 Tax=Candidatus Coxiella mudrowiae TaxID=2054173 RepID=UPI0006625F1B|nr:hypothetical protein [Candidatus Coxiella mudrowiae]